MKNAGDWTNGLQAGYFSLSVEMLRLCNTDCLLSDIRMIQIAQHMLTT